MMSASNLGAASARSLPFLTPDQASRPTVDSRCEGGALREARRHAFVKQQAHRLPGPLGRFQARLNGTAARYDSVCEEVNLTPRVTSGMTPMTPNRKNAAASVCHRPTRGFAGYPPSRSHHAVEVRVLNQLPVDNVLRKSYAGDARASRYH